MLGKKQGITLEIVFRNYIEISWRVKDFLYVYISYFFII